MIPDRIDPDMAPGGLVFRIYAAGDLHTEHSVSEADGLEQIPTLAHDDGRLALGLAVRYGSATLVVYDGDHGRALVVGHM